MFEYMLTRPFRVIAYSVVSKHIYGDQRGEADLKVVYVVLIDMFFNSFGKSTKHISREAIQAF